MKNLFSADNSDEFFLVSYFPLSLKGIIKAFPFIAIQRTASDFLYKSSRIGKKFFYFLFKEKLKWKFNGRLRNQMKKYKEQREESFKI